MHATKNDIPADKRAKLAELLNARLADLIDLQMQIKQAHWNVRGPNFIGLHKLFDELAGEVLEYVDDVAERTTALGGLAGGTVQVVGNRTSLAAYSTTISSWSEHVEAISSAIAATGKLIRVAIDQSGELGDADTADLFTGISRGVDKQLWFVEAHKAE